MTTPFTYLIGWTAHQKFYYGVRYRHCTSPTDLWTTYFTSSKRVKEYRKEFGEPDIIEVRRTFSSAKHACLWEQKVLRRIRAVKRKDFLNLHDMESKAAWKGQRLSEEHKAKIGDSTRGRKQTAEWIKKRTSDVWTDRQHSPASRAKMSESHKGIRRTGWNQPETAKTKLREWQTTNSPTRGTRWWNNGQGVRKRSVDSPGPEWTLGR